MKKVLAILAMAAFVACGDSAAPKEGENKDTAKPAETPVAPAPAAADTVKKDTAKAAAPVAAPADAKKDTAKKK